MSKACTLDHYTRLHGNGRSGHSLRWNGQPLKCSGFPVLLPIPFSPVQRARKFSAVLGTTSAKTSNTMRPTAKRKTKNKQTNKTEINYQIISMIFSHAGHMWLTPVIFLKHFIWPYWICFTDINNKNSKSTV